MLGHTIDVCKDKTGTHKEWRSVLKPSPPVQEDPTAQVQNLLPESEDPAIETNPLVTATSHTPVDRNHASTPSPVTSYTPMDRSHASRPILTPTDHHNLHHNPFQVLKRANMADQASLDPHG